MPELLSDIRSDLAAFFKNYIVIILLLIGCAALTIYIGGVYVNPYVDGIPAAILDEDNTSTSRIIVNAFLNSDSFSVNDYPSSKDGLRNTLENGNSHIGVYIPPGFEKDVKAGRECSVLLITDGANLIIGNNAYAAAAEVVQTIGVGVQVKTLESKGLMPDAAFNASMPFRFNDRVLYDPRMTYMNYLIIGFISVFFQQIMLSALGQSYIQRGREIAQRNVVLRLLAIYLVGFALVCLSVGGSFYIISRFFNVHIKGSPLVIFGMFLLYGLSMCAMSALLSAVLRDRIKYMQFSFMLSLPSFVSCGYVWPIDQMPKQLGYAIKLLWPLVYFSRNLDEYIIKGVAPAGMGQDMLCLGIFSLVWFVIAAAVFKLRFNRQPEPKEA